MSLENFIVFSPFSLNIGPPLAFLSNIYLLFFRGTLFLSPISERIMLFGIYSVLVSIFAAFLPFIDPQREEFFYSFLKQLASFLIGISTFFVIRGFFVAFGFRALYWVVLGAMPSVFISLIQMAGYLSGKYQFLAYADAIRTVIVGPFISHTDPSFLRLSGLSNEPSSFGCFLVLLVIPSTILIMQNVALGPLRELVLKTLLTISIICFLLTFSATSYLIAISFTVLLFFHSNNLSIKVIFLIITLFFIMVSLIIIVPNNYFMNHVNAFSDGSFDWVGKYGGTIGPIIMIKETYNLFGYGLGGTHANIEFILPVEWIEFMLIISNEDNINIKTLLGRIVAELGIVGLCLFLAIFYTTYFKSKRCSIKSASVLPPLIIAVLIATLGGNVGSFSHPLLWFWIAFIDVFYINKEPYKKNSGRKVESNESSVSG